MDWVEVGPGRWNRRAEAVEVRFERRGPEKPVTMIVSFAHGDDERIKDPEQMARVYRDLGLGELGKPGPDGVPEGQQLRPRVKAGPTG